MITMHKMTYPEGMQAAIRSMVERGSSVEELIAFMRASGLSKPHSIGLLRRATHLTLDETKEAVHFSPTWDDRRASDEAFHDTAVHALQEWQHEDDPSPERLAS